MNWEEIFVEFLDKQLFWIGYAANLKNENPKYYAQELSAFIRLYE